TGLPTSANKQHDPDNDMQYTFNQFKNWVYSEEKSRNDLVNIVIRDELICSTDTIKRDCLKLYQDHKNFVKKILQNISSRISLTTDIWTSQQQLSYSSITVCDCVKAIHTSPKCHQAFVDACDYKVIDIIIPSLDCTTYWNSIYNMLNSAIKVKQALLKLKSQNCYFPDPLSEDK
ncbi:5372_t:CDS:2, partial [Cetraspora pellucida]